jgi:hypothetical protein
MAFFEDVRIPVEEEPILAAPRVMEQMDWIGEETLEGDAEEEAGEETE